MSDIRAQLEEIDNFLDKYENEHIGLPNRKQSKAPKYLEASIEDLRKKTPEELAEAALELSLYALEVDRKISLERARERWAKIKLDELTAHFLKDIPSRYGWNERTLIARNDPEPCKALNMILKEIEMKLARLYNIPKHIEIISKCIDNLRFIALKREKSD